MNELPKFRIWDDVHGKEKLRFWYSDNLPDGVTYSDLMQWIERHDINVITHMHTCSHYLDSDGKYVYEGDILSIVIDGQPIHARVVDDLGAERLYFNSTLGSYLTQPLTASAKVIGNIFETPELVTEQLCLRHEINKK